MAEHDPPETPPLGTTFEPGAVRHGGSVALLGSVLLLCGHTCRMVRLWPDRASGVRHPPHLDAIYEPVTHRSLTYAILRAQPCWLDELKPAASSWCWMFEGRVSPPGIIEIYRLLACDVSACRCRKVEANLLNEDRISIKNIPVNPAKKSIAISIEIRPFQRHSAPLNIREKLIDHPSGTMFLNVFRPNIFRWFPPPAICCEYENNGLHRGTSMPKSLRHRRRCSLGYIF